MREIEKEPQRENEIWCAYCGPGWKADWELVTDEGEVKVCDNHRFVLREIHVVGMERRIGEKEWKEVVDYMNQDLDGDYLDDLGDWKDLIDYEEYKKDRRD